MGMYIPCINRSYLFATPSGSVRKYSWVGDPIDIQILRTLGVWKNRESETAKIQSKIIWAITPSGASHWSELDHKTFWEWVDNYELHA